MQSRLQRKVEVLLIPLQNGLIRDLIHTSNFNLIHKWFLFTFIQELPPSLKSQNGQRSTKE